MASRKLKTLETQIFFCILVSVTNDTVRHISSQAAVVKRIRPAEKMTSGDRVPDSKILTESPPSFQFD